MKYKHFCLLFGLMIQAVSLFAQDASIGKYLLSFHAGPSRYMGKMMGITDYSNQYRDGLRDGVAWNVNYYYLTDKNIFNSWKFAPGFIYEGSRYENSHSDGSDKILMHYVAPQLALFMVKKKYTLSLSTGLGYQFYKDKSTVYDTPRKVSMNKIAYNLSAAAEYLFSSQWGVSGKLNWIVSNSDSYSVRYHGQTWKVESPESSDGGGDFSHISLLIGLNYHF